MSTKKTTIYLRLAQTWNGGDGPEYPAGDIGRQWNIYQQPPVGNRGIIGYVVRTKKCRGEVCVYPSLYAILNGIDPHWIVGLSVNRDYTAHGPNGEGPGADAWSGRAWCNVVTNLNGEAELHPLHIYGLKGIDFLSRFFEIVYI